MQTNNYGDVIAAWKATLIVQRARRMGISEADLEDVQQELSLDVLAFRFDPARSNGATESTALTAVIDRRLWSLRRKWGRRLATSALPDAFDAADSGRIEASELAVDVLAQIERLPDRERSLCEVLIAGGSLEDARRQLGANGPSFNRLLGSIRKSFARAGLADWLPQPASKTSP